MMESERAEEPAGLTVAAPELAESPAGEPSPWERYAGMIVRPRETLARMTDADAWYWAGIMLAAGYTAYHMGLGVAAGHMLAQTFGAALARPPGSTPPPPGMQGFFRVFPVLTSTFSAAGVVLEAPPYAAFSWALRAVLFFALASMLGAPRVPWGRVFSMVGWAWAPLFIQFVLTGVALLAIPQVGSLLVGSATGITPSAQMASAQTKVIVHTLLEFSPFAVWNLALCVLGVEAVFRLPRWKSLIVVLAPTLVHLLLAAASAAFSISLFRAMSGMGPTPAPPGH